MSVAFSHSEHEGKTIIWHPGRSRLYLSYSSNLQISLVFKFPCAIIGPWIYGELKRNYGRLDSTRARIWQWLLARSKSLSYAETQVECNSVFPCAKTYGRLYVKCQFIKTTGFNPGTYPTTTCARSNFGVKKCFCAYERNFNLFLTNSCMTIYGDAR